MLGIFPFFIWGFVILFLIISLRFSKKYLTSNGFQDFVIF